MTSFAGYKTDKSKEINGVRKEFPPNDDQSVPFFVIARACKANPEYVKASQEASDRYKGKIRSKMMKPADWQNVSFESFFNGCLRDFGNIQDLEGNPIQTREELYSLLKELPDLSDELEDFSNSIENFRREEMEQDAGNSAK